MPTTFLVFWGAFLVSEVSALIKERVLFSKPFYPWGDAAINSLQVIRAEHLRQLVGNYSRVGFHHPGPALLYMLAGGEWLFADLLRAVPASYNGQILGVSVYVSLLIALSVLCLYRCWRSLGATMLAFAIAFLFAVHLALFGQDWFPVLYVAAFMLFVVAAAAVAAGRTRELPLFVLASGILVHGHVSFIAFVTATTVVVAVAWYVVHRRDWRHELRSGRMAMAGSAVIAALFALPMLLEVVLHYPGPWPQYLKYVHHAHHQPRSLGEVIRFVGRYWTQTGAPLWILVAAAIVGLGLAATERQRDRQILFVSIYGMVILQTLLTLYYVDTGVDELTPVQTYSYVAFFYKNVPLLMLVAAAGHLWIRAREAAGRRLPRVSPLELSAPIGLVALVLFGFAYSNSSLGYVGRSYSGFASVVAAIRDDPNRAGRPVALYEDLPGDWVEASGIAAQMQRIRLPWCLDQYYRQTVLLYTATYLCHGDVDRWSIHATAGAVPPGASIVWSGPLITGQVISVYSPAGS